MGIMGKIRFETPLCELAFKYKTDKCPQIGHTYTPRYYELLKDKKESFKKVLELGVGTVVSMKHVKGYIPGASHRMWRDFFPNAMIYGTDIDPRCLFEDDRIKTFQVDTHRDWKKFSAIIKEIGYDIDLVIDDGPHKTPIQLVTVRRLMPILDKGVIYIIEDSHNPYAIRDNLPEYDCEVLDLTKEPTELYKNGKNDNSLVIVKHK